MYNVNLVMQDTTTGETVTRSIDKTNAMYSGDVCWQLGDKASQRQCLESWIKERGNQQHEMDLTLISWSFD